MRATLVVLAMMPLLAPLGAPHVSAQDGCTPCECGAAACVDGEIHWPLVEWVELPDEAVAGEPFNVTYRTSWYLWVNETRLLPPGGGPRTNSHLTWFNASQEEAPVWSYQVSYADQPNNVTVTIVWPTPGELTLRAAFGLAGLSAEGDRWTNTTTLHILPATAAEDSVREPNRDAPVSLAVTTTALAALLLASRRRNW